MANDVCPGSAPYSRVDSRRLLRDVHQLRARWSACGTPSRTARCASRSRDRRRSSSCISLRSLERVERRRAGARRPCPAGLRDEQHRIALRAELARPGSCVGRKPLPQQRRAAVGLRAAGDQHDEAGQVLVLAAEAVRDPRAHARPAEPRRPGVQEDLRRRVVELRRCASTARSQMSSAIVREMRQQVGDLLRPTCRAARTCSGEPSSFGAPLMNANRSPLTNVVRHGWPSHLRRAPACSRTGRAATARRPCAGR